MNDEWLPSGRSGGLGAYERSIMNNDEQQLSITYDKKSKESASGGELTPETTQVFDSVVGSPIELLHLSRRTYNCLDRVGIDTIEQLKTWSDEDLLGINNFGAKSLAEVREKVGNPQPMGQVSPADRSPPDRDAFSLPEAAAEWSNIPGLNISSNCLRTSFTLDRLNSIYPTIAHLIYALQTDLISLSDEQEKAELRTVLKPFMALRDASKTYLEWFGSLDEQTIVKVLTEYQWTPDKLEYLYPREILSAIPSGTTYEAIISEKIPSKRFASIAEEIDDWLNYILKEKEKSILTKRMGLYSGEVQNVVEIGRELGLSRERVKQLENQAKKKLHGQSNKYILLQFRKVAIETIRSAGCICTLEDWCEAITEIYTPGKVHFPSTISCIVDSIAEINSVSISGTQLVYIEPITNHLLSNIQARIGEFWKKNKFSDRSPLHQLIIPLLPEQISNAEKVADLLIDLCCYQSVPNIFTAYKWKLKDYSYYVLYRAGKPLHFSEVAKRMKELNPDWEADNIIRAAQGVIERNPDLIRCGRGVYGLKEWGTMEYKHFNEVILDYLSKQPLPVDADEIYSDLSKTYQVTEATVIMNLSLHPNLFQKFGNLYGVAGRRYELPDRKLINLLVAKLELEPVRLNELERDEELVEYDRHTLNLYLNVSPLFCQIGSFKQRKFALSVDSKRHYQPEDASKIVADI